MREQAGLIQSEVQRLADDISRLDERADNLQRHFGQAQEDLRLLLVSSEKVTKLIHRIGEVDLSHEDDLLEIESSHSGDEQVEQVKLPSQ